MYPNNQDYTVPKYLRKNEMEVYKGDIRLFLMKSNVIFPWWDGSKDNDQIKKYF